MFIKNRYDKYIDCEFTFEKEGYGLLHINYEGAYKEKYGDFHCSRCGKELKPGNIVHTFDIYGEDGKTGNDGSYQFGSECVKHVFSAGLIKHKECLK